MEAGRVPWEVLYHVHVYKVKTNEDQWRRETSKAFRSQWRAVKGTLRHDHPLSVYGAPFIPSVHHTPSQASAPAKHHMSSPVSASTKRPPLTRQLPETHHTGSLACELLSHLPVSSHHLVLWVLELWKHANTCTFSRGIQELTSGSQTSVASVFTNWATSLAFTMCEQEPWWNLWYLSSLG